VKGEGLWEAEDDNNATGGRQGEGESTVAQESSRTRRQAILVDMRSSGVVPVIHLQRSSSSSTGSDSRSQGQQQQQGGRSQGQQQQGQAGRSQGQQQQGQAAGRSQGQQQQGQASRSQGQLQQQQAGSYMSQGLLRPSGGFGANYPRSGIGGYPTYPSGSVTLGDYAGTGRSTAGTYMGFG
jgi:hypothetical protein